MRDPKTLAESLDYFCIGEEDLELLATAAATLESSEDHFVEQFYRHLINFPATQRLLRDPDVRRRLLESQRHYLRSLAGEKIDTEYVQDRARIGARHEIVGLEPSEYLGAYALYSSLLIPMLSDAAGGDTVRAARTITALVKRLFFDVHIAMDQYIERRESELARVNDELRTASRKLTREAESTQSELRRSERRAQAAEELAAFATLAAGLAHEIGTPMGVIRGHAESLESAVSDERSQWRLEMILQQIDRITGIIQSLLNIAKPKQAERVFVDFGDLVQSTLSFLSQKLQHRDVELDAEIDEECFVTGDPERLQQMLLNLFLNAVDAMPDGGTLRVRLERRDAQVQLEISDTGTGISPNELAHIFDPFFTTKEAGRGSGLGLVVVHEIAVDHGGDISVESEVGSGTHFSIEIPRLEGSDAVPAPTSR